MSRSRSRTPALFVAGVSLLFATAAFLLFHQRPKNSLVILGEDFSNLHALESLKGEYRQKYGIDLEFVGASFDSFNQKANQDLANGTSLHDVILHYSSVLGT